MAETQAEKNKRIEAMLAARGKKFTPGAQVREKAAKRAEKRERVAEAAMPAAKGRKKEFTSEQGTTLASQALGGLAGKAAESARERKARMRRLEDAVL